MTSFYILALHTSRPCKKHCLIESTMIMTDRGGGCSGETHEHADSWNYSDHWPSKIPVWDSPTNHLQIHLPPSPIISIFKGRGKMNDEMRDVQSTPPAPPSATSSTSGELDQVTTLSDQSGSPVILSVDKIPLVWLSSNIKFTSFSELSKFLKELP